MDGLRCVFAYNFTISVFLSCSFRPIFDDCAVQCKATNKQSPTYVQQELILIHVNWTKGSSSTVRTRVNSSVCTTNTNLH